MSRRVLSKWCEGNTFYDVANNDTRISDIEERITEQARELTAALCELWTSLLEPTMDIALSAVSLYFVLGGRAVLAAGGYMAVVAVVLRYIAPNFRGNELISAKLEARFKAVGAINRAEAGRLRAALCVAH